LIARLREAQGDRSAQEKAAGDAASLRKAAEDLKAEEDEDSRAGDGS